MESSSPAKHSIDPTLQFFILCDNVASVGSKPVFVGVFDQILRPGPIPQFAIATRWTNGIGKHQIAVSILDPDLKEIATFNEDIELNYRASQETDIFSVVNFVFPESGVYWFKVTLNGRTVASIPLPVQKGA